MRSTFLFTKELILSAISPLWLKQSYSKKNDPGEDQMQNLVYTLGDITIARVYGKFTVNGINIHGQRERIRIPVRTNLCQ
jgi:hypothetical protein